MLNRPFFSVIIPVYNKLPHLERSVNSVLNQSCTDFELLLVDDASTDGSAEKLVAFGDARIKLYRRSEPGPGGYAARNVGVAQATGRWICFLDADDEWDLNVLDTVYQYTVQDPDAELISWGWYWATGRNKILDKFSTLNKKHVTKPYTLEDFFYGPQPICTGAVAMKIGVMTNAGMFPERGFKRGGDLDTWGRCLWHSKRSVWLNGIRLHYYIDSVNMVTKTVERDLMFIFSPFLQELAEKDNPKLKNAIRHFQNRYLYILLNGHVYQGNRIDYTTVKKMNLNVQGLWLILKLHLNVLRLSVRGARHQSHS